MRIYLSLIVTAILLSFLTAYFALNLQKDHFASAEEIQTLFELQTEFQKNTRPVLELDLSSMYPTRDYVQLIQPIVHAFGEASRFSKGCGEQSGRMTRNSTSKVETWEAFRCRETLRLPDTFFEFSPFIHESGVSYAYLAFTSGMPGFGETSWVKKHLNFFHISELRLLPGEGLDENFRILSNLDSSQYEGLTRGDRSLLGEEYLLIRKAQKMGSLYQVFARLDFEKFLDGRPYLARPLKNGERCFYADGSICWQKDASNLLQMLRPSSILIFVVSVLILILVSLSLYSRIMLQNREEERKRHALRVLTHELRTPIANLLLQIESLNQQSDLIAPSVLEDLLRMEGEVYRLKRLAEKSSSYLNSQNDKDLISFEFRDHKSINDLIAHILEDYRGHYLTFTPLVQDRGMMVDGYWFSICLKNLIENAIHHGAVPINVSLHEEEQFLRIDIRDHGQCQYPSLDALFRTERQESSNGGLGMGLSLVQKIMKEMKGKLAYHPSPTTFTLYLRKTV